MNEKEYYLLIDKYKNKLIDSDTFDKEIEKITRLMESSQKEIIRCAVMNAYFNNCDYDKAEEYANTILNSNNLEILFELANYYVKTRRYDIANSIYKILLARDQKYIMNSYNDFQKIIMGTKRPYLPDGDENQIKYIEFLNKMNINSDFLVREILESSQIPFEEDSTSKKLSGLGFKNFVAFDLETTGFDSNKDGITEIGAIKVIDGKIVESKEFIFQELIHPYKKRIPSKVEELTGITNEMVDGARDIRDVFPKFVEFIGDNILVGYNCIAFDSKFILEAARLSNIVINNSYFDVMHYAKKFKLELNCENNKLNTVANRLGIVNEEAHRALADAITTAKVYLKLLEIEESR